MQNTKLTISIVILAIVALAAGIWLQQRILTKHNASQLASGSVFPAAKEIASFNLIDSKGRTFTNANLKGHWSLMYFGFTRCPSLCPTTLATLSQVYKNLVTAKYPQLPQVIFVSVDPKIDELARIDKYITAFNPHFVGVTGDLVQLHQLANQVGVTFNEVYAEDDPKHTGSYVMNHSGSIIVFNPAGKLYAVFTMPHEAARLTKDFQTMTANPTS